MPLSAISCAKYLKTKCPSYTPDLVHCYRSGSTLKIVVIDHGKLRVLDLFPEKYSMDRYTGQLELLLQGKPWNGCKYVQAHTSLNNTGKLYSSDEDPFGFSKNCDVGSVIVLPEDANYDYVHFLRRTVDWSLGFKDVGMVENALTPEQWANSPEVIQFFKDHTR